ncbi:hypothetical protein Dimus_025963 [Dionaea muscipula]
MEGGLREGSLLAGDGAIRCPPEEKLPWPPMPTARVGVVRVAAARMEHHPAANQLAWKLLAVPPWLPSSWPSSSPCTEIMHAWPEEFGLESSFRKVRVPCSPMSNVHVPVAQAVTYNVINNAADTPGGIRFATQISTDYSRQTLDSATAFIWGLFQENSNAERKNVQQVTLLVESMDGVAYTSADQIHLSANYVQGYSGDLKREVTGILYHEMTHVWQWNGNGNAPGGLIEGIADYVRLKAGYAPSHWVQPGQGDRWDQGYDVTAYFLDYCSSLRGSFVAELNRKMRDGYSASYFNDLLGRSVDQLWSDYKAMYDPLG